MLLIAPTGVLISWATPATRLPKAAILLDDARVRCIGVRALLAQGDEDDGKGANGLTPAERLAAYAARDAALALEALAAG